MGNNKSIYYIYRWFGLIAWFISCSGMTWMVVVFSNTGQQELSWIEVPKPITEWLKSIYKCRVYLFTIDFFQAIF